MQAGYLNPNRFFEAEPAVREIAHSLYTGVKDMPIVCPHGHVEPKLLADNAPFSDPTDLIIIPDHYIFRLLYSQGVPMESLGIPTIDGTPVETDRRKIWQLFGEHFYLFAGTPTGAWLAHEFAELFGVAEKLNGKNALRIYDEISEKLTTPAFLPRTLFERFNIELLTTTDGAADSLIYHKKLQDSGWPGKIVPCFRPDAVVNILAADWINEITRLGQAADMEIGDFQGFVRALENRRAFFKSMGAVSTDQGVVSPLTLELSPGEANRIFQRALRGRATEADATRFSAHILMEMARMSVDDGLVMQIHPGSLRNHNEMVFTRFGTDIGGDIPLQTEYTKNLRPLLNKFGNDPGLRLVVFTLDESAYSRELAPLAGHYPAMKLGPPWWFHDSFEGMMRFRERVTETASIYNTVGFNDDTRAFASIPARHDLARRVDSNYLAKQVARHAIDMEDAQRMARALAYDLVKNTYRM